MQGVPVGRELCSCKNSLTKIAEPLKSHLDKAGILIKFFSGKEFPDFVRITVGTPDQNSLLIHEMEKYFSHNNVLIPETTLTHMHCVILAAGTASRLRPLTDSTPKCLLHVGSRSILERTIRAVFHAGVIHFTVVVGFQDWMVKNFLKRNFPSLDFTFVVNNQFDTTNNAFSLLLAREEIEGHELLLLDGDIVFDDELIPLLIKSPHQSCFAVRTNGRYRRRGCQS